MSEKCYPVICSKRSYTFYYMENVCF